MFCLFQLWLTDVLKTDFKQHTCGSVPSAWLSEGHHGWRQRGWGVDGGGRRGSRKILLSKASTEAEEGRRVDFLERKLCAQPPGASLALQPQAQRAGLTSQEAPGLAGMTLPGRYFDLPSLPKAGALSLLY